MTKTKHHLKKLDKQSLIGLVIILVVAVIGVKLIISSHAQSPYSAVNASSGTLTSPAQLQSGSGSNAVQFGYTPTTALAVHVDGYKLVNGQGNVMRLFGADVSGTEDACIQNKGFSWIPSSFSLTTAAQAIASWHINAVRVQLNEDCWLGINGAPAAYSGANYQTYIKSWVSALNSAGIYTILDLHWAAPGAYSASQQWPMADADHSLTFWSQVASTYKSDQAVIFDPFNEPFIGTGAPTASDWSCWNTGNCSTTFSPTVNGVVGSPVTYQVAGMQQMVTTIRNAGAIQPIMVGGLNWSGDPCGTINGGLTNGVCTQLANMPNDPDKQLAISFHTYNWTACTSATACWDPLAAAAKAANIPIITGELGERDCSTQYIDGFMNWADQNDLSYIVSFWDVNTSPNNTCVNGSPNDTTNFISSYDGTPSPVEPQAGVDFKAHLLKVN